MSAILRTKTGKTPTNLTLSRATIRQGRELARLMNRPSLSNVVEHLIAQAWASNKPTPAKP